MTETETDQVMMFILDFENRKDNPHLQGDGAMLRHLYEMYRLRDYHLHEELMYAFGDCNCQEQRKAGALEVDVLLCPYESKVRFDNMQTHGVDR